MLLKRMAAAIIAAAAAFLLIPTASAESVKIDLYIDGELAPASYAPIDKDGVPMLPLRSILEEFGIKVNWNQSSKITEFYNGAQGYFIVPQVQNGYEVFITRYEYPDEDLIYEDWYHPPVIIGGRTYVSLALLREILGVYISWDREAYDWNGKSNRVSIQRPFKYINGEWYQAYYSTDNLTFQIGFEYNNKLERETESDSIFAANHEGTELTMGRDYLYRLSAGGQSRLITSYWGGTGSYKTDEDSVYMLLYGGGSDVSFPSFPRIIRISLKNPYIQYELGEKGFRYTVDSQLYYSGESGYSYINEYFLGVLGIEDPAIVNENDGYELREDGVYAIGFNAALVSSLYQIESSESGAMQAMRESYGYYLISIDYGGGHIQMTTETMEIVE